MWFKFSAIIAAIVYASMDVNNVTALIIAIILLFVGISRILVLGFAIAAFIGAFVGAAQCDEDFFFIRNVDFCELTIWNFLLAIYCGVFAAHKTNLEREINKNRQVKFEERNFNSYHNKVSMGWIAWGVQAAIAGFAIYSVPAYRFPDGEKPDAAIVAFFLSCIAASYFAFKYSRRAKEDAIENRHPSEKWNSYFQ